MRRALVRSQWGKVAGFTILEMVVSITIMAIIGLVTLQLVRGGYVIFRRGQVSSSVNTEADSLTSRISNALRGTYSVQAASATSITVLSYYVPADATPTKVTITQTGNNLTLTTIIGVVAGDSYTYDQAAAVTKTISTHMLTGVATPLFTYYDESNNLLAAPIVTQSVHLVETTVYIYSPTDQARTASSSTKVELRNLKTNL